MKKVFFALTCILIGSTVFANSNTIKFENPGIVSISNEIELTLDLGDLTNKPKEKINKVVEYFISKNLQSVDDQLHCKITVKGRINVGVGTVEISVEVSGPCSEIKKNGKEIAGMILDAVKDAMQ
jgi:hypothetical protein